MLSFPRAFGAAGLSMLLAACAMAPPTESPVQASAIAAPAQGPVYRVDAAASSVRILVFRGGLASSLGHNHVLDVPELTGYVQVPGQDPGKAAFELAFRLDGLRVDPAGLRQALGPGWASVPSPEAIAGTRANMLGEAVLQADRFPVVRIRSLKIAGAAPKLAAQVDIELHGQHRELWLPMVVDIDPGRVRAAGAFVIRQSDYGIAPFSVLGGLLAVQDELIVEFDLQALIER